MAKYNNIAEYSRIWQCGRIWQNTAIWQIIAKYGNILLGAGASLRDI